MLGVSLYTTCTTSSGILEVDVGMVCVEVVVGSGGGVSIGNVEDGCKSADWDARLGKELLDGVQTI